MHRRLLLLAFLVTLPAALLAADHHHEWNWLSAADRTRLLASIPAAPAPGTAIDRADEKTILSVQASRTPAQIAEAMDDKQFRIDIVSRAVGPAFTPEHDPITFALLRHVLEDSSNLVSTLKDRYARRRPFQAHAAEVHPLFTADQFSYPSGHSTGAHILADILDQLFPARAAALNARADAVGESRVTAGVHYPSDVAAGKKLARALADALLANPAFQKDLAAAKAEVAAKSGG